MTKLVLWIKIIWAALSSRSNQAFYDKISTFYDDVYVEHEEHARTIINILNEFYKEREKKALVLDLGCGTGMVSGLLSQKGFNVIGVDISLASLRVHQENYPQHKLIQADANYLPIADNAFDSVVSLGVWRHFPDIEKVLDEVSRVLTSDGVFIVGYFPPAMAGSIDLNQKWWGRLLIRLYQILTTSLGYIDRADFSLEEETIEIARRKFKSVTKIESTGNKYLLLGHSPLKSINKTHKVDTRTQDMGTVKLNEILRCPSCMTNNKENGLLKLNQTDWLTCQEPQCNHKYPIDNGIPILLNKEGEKWINTSTNNLPGSISKP